MMKAMIHKRNFNSMWNWHFDTFHFTCN